MRPLLPVRRRRAASPSRPSLLAAAFVLVASASHAQYKIVGPDGKVSYSDRPSPAADGKINQLGARAATTATDAELPFELRQVAAKYPVTLYTVTGTCDPCNAARQLLKQRGVPFAERQVVTSEDSEALERLSGAREAPTVTIGPQTLRGFAADTWVSYLDAAGYPRESRLPSSYQYRPATPIVDRRDAGPAQSAGPGQAAAAAPTPQAPSTDRPSGIRF